MRRIALAVLLAVPATARAGGNSGLTTADFLVVEHGARALGMGGAFVSLADDASGLWWNPASVARISLREASFSHAALVEGMVSQYAAAAVPLPRKAGTLAASYTYFSVPGLDGYDAAGNFTGKLNAHGYAGSLAYARGFAVPELTIGANVKAVGQKLASVNATGVAVDAGFQYKRERWGLGVAVQNMGPGLVMAGAYSPLPLNVRGGIYAKPHSKVTLAVDEEKLTHADFKIHAGAEWKVSPAFALRGGYQQLTRLGFGAGYSFGVGYIANLGGAAGGWAGEDTPWWERKLDEPAKAKPVGSYLMVFDYAFISYGAFGDTHRFTLGVKF